MIRRELTPQDYLAMLRRRWVVITVLAIVGAPIAYVVSRLLPSKYTSKTSVLIEPPTVSKDLIRPVITDDVRARLAGMQQQILSRTRLEPIIQRFGLYSQIHNATMDDLVLRLQKAIEVTPIRPMEDTSSQLAGFDVTVTLDNPRDAQNVCSTITSMFIEENSRLRQQHSADTTEFLAQQLADAKTKLDEQDAKLAAFKSKYLYSLPDDDKTNLNILMGMTSQLDAATQALSRAQQDKTFVESELNQALDAWQATQKGHNPQTLQQQLDVLQAHLADLQTRYTDNYPDVVAAKNDIAALKKRIAEGGETSSTTNQEKETKATALEPEGIQQLRAQLHGIDQVIAAKTREQEDLKAQIKIYQGRVQSTPVVEQQYKELTRGYQTALDSFNQLQKDRDQAAMATQLEHRQEGETFRVLDPANLPDKPSFPNRLLFALGGLGGGLGLGLGLAYILEMKDTSIRTERDVEFALKLPVIAMLPSIEPEEAMRPARPAKALPGSIGVGAKTSA